MDDKQLEQVMEKLDRIIQLLALDAVKELEPRDQISRLSDLRFQPAEIASIVGKTPNAVSIALHYIRKKGSKANETGTIEDVPTEQTREE